MLLFIAVDVMNIKHTKVIVEIYIKNLLIKKRTSYFDNKIWSTAVILNFFIQNFAIILLCDSGRAA